MTIYDLSMKTSKGDLQTLEVYRGQVLLIVNVASQCGFTPQYQDLEILYKKFQARGFTILAFPCNQFGAQEPGTDNEIVSFCELNYGITFPIFAKIEVNGSQESPLYTFLKQEAPGLLGLQAIKWNFTKFLIDRQGKVRDRFAPVTKPQSLEADIEALL